MCAGENQSSGLEAECIILAFNGMSFWRPKEKKLVASRQKKGDFMNNVVYSVSIKYAFPD